MKRKSPIKHAVRSHKKEGTVVHGYVRGKGAKTPNIADPHIHSSASHEETLKRRAIATVIDNYYAYQDMLDEKDIYNDFNDELVDSLNDEKMPERDVVFITKFIQTDEFWNRLYAQEPSMRGYIMW